MPQDDYLSRILEQQGPTTMALAGEKPAFVETRDPRYVSDAYQYFLNQGQSAAPGGITAAPIDKGPSSPPITSADYPEGYTGPMLSGITSASAVQPTSDPFLASGAAGGARLPTMDQAGAVAAMTQDPAYSLPGQIDPFLASGAAGGARLPTAPIGPRATLPSGDVFATDDPMLQEKMDYTEKTPAWWESARDKFVNTGQDVGNFFTNLAGQGIDLSKMAGSAIMNMVVPGAGLAAQLIPEETQIDKFNREYQLGGDLYQNVVSQVDDPKFEGRLEGYADDLIAGTGEGKDPFGKNTVSAYGDYPAMATETYNELIEKQKQRATEGKELSQFDKDRLDYYGHVSGLTGKTNIPGTPLMTDTSPLKTTPGGDMGPTTIEDIEDTAPDYFLGNTRLKRQQPGEEIWTPGTASEVAGKTIVDPNRIDSTVKVGAGARGTIDRTQPTIEEALGIEPTTESAMQEQIAAAEAQEAARVREINAENIREEAAQRDRENAANRAAAQQAAAQQAAANAAAARARDRHTGDGGGGEGPKDTGPKDTPSGPPAGGPHGNGGGAPSAPSTPDYSNVRTGGPPSRGGSGGGSPGQGGKIVCTMMNDSYGFGSFRNKIWIKYARDHLSPEYQKGYHKIFLPLVKYAKQDGVTNRIVKKVLEHIAIHRTIDIRQEARGKTHLLGRIYRKILEPICYWAGKNA